MLFLEYHAHACGCLNAMLILICLSCSWLTECLQAAYLVAVLAEHHCTHQLIIAQDSIAALLQIMHTAGQVHTMSRTLDLVSGSTALQARHLNGSLCTTPFSGRAAGPLAASAEASAASVTHSASDVMSVRMLDAESAAAGSKAPELASSKEVCRQEQSAHQGDDSPPASSAASAESVSHDMPHTGPQGRIDSHDTGVCSDSDCEPNQATTGECGGDQEVSSSYTDTGRGSVTAGQHDGDAGAGVSSSSIHSRLLRAARAAKAGSSGKAQENAVAFPAPAAAFAAAADEATAVTVARVYAGSLCFFSVTTCYAHMHAQHHQTPNHMPALSAHVCKLLIST